MASALAVEIAELRGWTVKPFGSVGRGWWLCDIGGNQSDDGFGTTPEEAWGYVPEPDKDPAAAFALLEYLQTFRGVSRGEAMDDVGAGSFRIYTDKQHCVEWSIWRGKNGYAIADTLTEAVALACRDALRTLKEATG